MPEETKRSKKGPRIIESEEDKFRRTKIETLSKPVPEGPKGKGPRITGIEIGHNVYINPNALARLRDILNLGEKAHLRGEIREGKGGTEVHITDAFILKKKGPVTRLPENIIGIAVSHPKPVTEEEAAVPAKLRESKGPFTYTHPTRDEVTRALSILTHKKGNVGVVLVHHPKSNKIEPWKVSRGKDNRLRVVSKRKGKVPRIRG